MRGKLDLRFEESAGRLEGETKIKRKSFQSCEPATHKLILPLCAVSNLLLCEWTSQGEGDMATRGSRIHKKNFFRDCKLIQAFFSAFRYDKISWDMLSLLCNEKRKKKAFSIFINFVLLQLVFNDEKIGFFLLIKNNGEERISITQNFHVNILLIKHVRSGLGCALMGPVSISPSRASLSQLQHRSTVPACIKKCFYWVLKHENFFNSPKKLKRSKFFQEKLLESSSQSPHATSFKNLSDAPQADKEEKLSK